MASSSSREIQREIEAQIRKDAELRLKTKEAAEGIRDEVRAETPVDTGRAAASVQVEKRKDRGGLPTWWVGSRLWYFHFLENGTGPDPADSKSRFGPDTPTKEYAPFAKVAHRHGGTKDGIEVDG
jgi:HK97 gp10 family phage protein